MVAFIIYWAAIIACIAWGVFFNVIAIIALAIVLLVYKTWDFGILTYSSLIYTILASLGVLTVLQAILGREPKAVKA